MWSREEDLWRKVGSTEKPGHVQQQQHHVQQQQQQQHVQRQQNLHASDTGCGSYTLTNVHVNHIAMIAEPTFYTHTERHTSCVFNANENFSLRKW